MATTLKYPTSVNCTQKTLDAALLSGVTAAVTLNSVVGIQNKAGVFVVDRVDSNGTATPSKREYVIFTGVSGSTLTTLTRNADGGGTDQDHAVGAIVEFVSDVLQEQAILDALLLVVTTAGVLNKATGATINTGTDDATIVTPKAIADSYLGVQGGWSVLGACTYEASDDPTYTFSFASDMTGVLSVGMKIKLTDSTVQYFIVTVVGAFSGGKTIITGYGGTDYNLSGGAITLPYYSTQKAPLGFSLNPVKWTVSETDTTLRSQAATDGTVYNMSGIAITIPIGSWKVSYQIDIQTLAATSIAHVFSVGLSTANNTIIGTYSNNIKVDALTVFRTTFEKSFDLNLTTKSIYYMNEQATGSGLSFYLINDSVPLIIKTICAYL